MTLNFKTQWYKDRLAKKRAKGFRGYPVATIAYYGPDDTRATKVSVGIIEHEGAAVDILERWYSTTPTTDVRTDAGIAEAIFRFIETHGAKSVAAVDGIIGCPHEEGIDYPDGAKCPQCSFWATRDRWSGDSIH